MKRLMLATALLVAGVAAAQEKVDLDMTGRIRAEAFNRSQVMATLNHLTDEIGPRLTNSPSMAEANRWTGSKFSEWGLSNVHDEAVDDRLRRFCRRHEREPGDQLKAGQLFGDRRQFRR